MVYQHGDVTLRNGTSTIDPLVGGGYYRGYLSGGVAWVQIDEIAASLRSSQ